MHKTLELLKRNFFWPGMVKDIRTFVRSCETCKTTKHPNFVMKPEMGKQIVTTRPFQRLYIDILGPYPRSKSGHRNPHCFRSFNEISMVATIEKIYLPFN